MTLKEILDSVLLESGLATEAQYVANQDDAVVRLVSFANRASVDLVAGFDWTRLRRVHTFTMSASETYALPDDFESLIADTAYANSYVVPIDFQTDSQQWAYLKVNGTGTGPRYRFRIYDNLIHVHAPQSGEEVRFEYMSNAPVLSGAARQKRFTADTDTYLLDDDLLILGTLWRHKKLLGQDWQESLVEYRSLLRTKQGGDGGIKTLGEDLDRDYPWGEPYTDTWVNNP